MDILGFLVVLAALIVAPRLGLDDAALQCIQRARARAVVTYHEARDWFLVHAVRPTQWLLAVSVVAQIAIAATAANVAGDREHELTQLGGGALALADKLAASMSWLAWFAIVSVAAHALNMWWQWSSRPRFRREQVHRNPNDPQSPLIWVDALDENGSLVLNEEHADYRPGRFSFKRSIGLVLFTHMILATVLMWVGVQSESTPLFTLGAICLYLAIAIVSIFASFIAWLLEKSVSLLEFTATVVSKELLVALPGFQWSNIEQHLSEVNLLEQERLAAALRSFAPSLALHLTPFVAVVWMWPYPTVAKSVLAFLFITTLAGWYLAKNGGALEVADRKYKFARLMFYALPGLCLAAFLYKLLPDGIHAVVEGQLGNLTGGLVGYGSGQKAVTIDGPWQNLGSGFVWFIMGCTIGTIAFFLAPEKESGKPRRWFYGAAMALTGLCFLAMFWRGYGLVKNISGEASIRAPEVPALAKAAPLPSVTVAAPGAAPTPSPPPNGNETKPDVKPPPKPAAGGGRGKEPGRHANASRPATPGAARGAEDLFLPEFLELERRLEAGR